MGGADSAVLIHRLLQVVALVMDVAYVLADRVPLKIFYRLAAVRGIAFARSLLRTGASHSRASSGEAPLGAGHGYRECRHPNYR